MRAALFVGRRQIPAQAVNLIAAQLAFAIIILPLNVWTLAMIFLIGGVYVGIEETLEDSLCAELVGEEHHGMAFGTLATVNGIGDFLSSVIVGALWTTLGTGIAFGYSAALFVARRAACGEDGRSLCDARERLASEVSIACGARHVVGIVALFAA